MLSSPTWGYTEVVLLSGGEKAGGGSQEKQSVGEALGTKSPGALRKETVYNPWSRLLRLLRTENVEVGRSFPAVLAM